MSRAYEDDNLVLKKHRVSCFDLGYELHPTLDLLTPGFTQPFETRDLILRTQALAEAISNSHLSLTCNDAVLIPAVLATLSLLEDNDTIIGYSSSAANARLSRLGEELKDGLLSCGRLKVQDISNEPTSDKEKWRIYWFSKRNPESLQAAIDFFTTHPKINGAIFIVGFARSGSGGIISKSGSRRYRTIENATGLGEIYFL